MAAPRPRRADDEIVAVGYTAHPFRDLYHHLLRSSWWWTVGIISLVFLLANTLFAGLYLEVDGIARARPGSFADAFYFSVQTMATIGYGEMHPQGEGTNLLVVAEALVGLLFTAVSTGLVFSKFSLSSAQIVFSRWAVVTVMDGVPTLMFRVGNDRAGSIFETQIRLALVRTERTQEGATFYRMHDLKLARDRAPTLSRSWTVLHRITADSPLFGKDAASFRADESELIATVVGTDDTSLQPVHGRRTYLDEDIAWGERLADVLSERPDGRLQLDLARFHLLEREVEKKG